MGFSFLRRYLTSRFSRPITTMRATMAGLSMQGDVGLD